MHMPNMAFKNFLVKGLGFENFELGLLQVGAVIFGWLGLVVYRDFFFVLKRIQVCQGHN